MVEPWNVAAAESSFRNRTYGGHGRLPASCTDGGPNIDDHRTTRIGNSWQGFTTINPYHDGHLWRKYGEKTISGLAFPRCYYKCTYSPCPAKKRVEQQSNNYPPLFLVTYQREHTCKAAPACAHEHTPQAPLPPPPPPPAAVAEQFLLKFESEDQEVRELRHSPTPPIPCINTEDNCGDPLAIAAPLSGACAQEVENPAASSRANGGRDDIPWEELGSLGFEMEYLMDSWDDKLFCSDSGSEDVEYLSWINLWG